jgi:transmembrane sensor
VYQHARNLTYNKNMTTANFIDFLENNHFKEWVLNPQDAQLSVFWEKWLLENPNEKTEIEAFKTLVLKMNQPISALDEKAEQGLWKSIQNTIEAETEVNTTRIVPIFNKWWAMAAAVVFLLAASLYLLVGQTSNTQTIQTAYGETRQVTLPDGSEVVLNAHSTLSFGKKWQIGADREVSLKGEAYFIVNEQGTTTHRDRFIVHTEGVDVEVLGTRFNVNSYRPQTQVVLQKGSVDIITKQANQQTQKYNLVPNQCAVFDNQKNAVSISQVNSNVFVGWKDKRFVFDKTPLSEVAIMLENTYGTHVIINDKELASKQISGEIPTSERKSLLLALSTLYSLKITEQDKDTLVISQLSREY